MATSGNQSAQYATLPHDQDRWHGLSSTALTPSPTLPELPHTPLSAAFEDLAGTVFVDEPPAIQRQLISDVLRSLTSSQPSTHSYELVEEDDYEQSQRTPRLPKRMSQAMADDRPSNLKEDTPVRTASISKHLPLHNPTPDLQSLQGAYLKNVQALEDSAERMSLASSMEEELHKIKMDIRRSESMSKSVHSATDHSARKYSSTSMSNSIIAVNAAARSGIYSPNGFITSPVGSVHSQRRFSQRGTRTSKTSNLSTHLPEPELEGRPLESAMVHSPPAHAMQTRQSSDGQPSFSQQSTYDRPATSASNDTYRQAQNLFTDFDGIHFSPAGEDDMSRHISLNRPPLARDSKVYREPQPDQNMVYYPAPVPVMLNLPKRLSTQHWSHQEKRRSQALSSIPLENRKSAAWLANAEIDAEYKDEKPTKRLSNIPPQLRASAYFDAPGTRTDVQLKHGSAVITLDSILDAAAHAPVSAFTDHPIVGQLGNEVYGQEVRRKKQASEEKQKRRSSLSNILTRRKSSGAMDGTRRLSQHLGSAIEVPEDDPERAAERSIAPGEDELVDDEKRDFEEKGDVSDADEDDGQQSQHELGFLGAPTTLLAELQLRKAQQKQRNRTAANAFPAGMHSTLLELDAVTQLQQKSRKQKHVALAWEDQDIVDRANFDDDDVPLGVLFPEKERQAHLNLSRPLGLMEKKELEENEPLGARRARLRGEEYKPAALISRPNLALQETGPTVSLTGVDDEAEEEHEGETLAQRRQRMQEKNKRISLVDDSASQLVPGVEQLGGSKTPEAAGPEEEETLGQRRKRLQAEAEKNATTALKPKISMGDLLRANPVGPRNGASDRQLSAESKVSLLTNRKDSDMALVDHIQASQPASKAIPSPYDIDRNPPPYFPNQPLLGHSMQIYQPSQHPGMQRQQMHQLQSTPNLHMTNGMAQQYPYNMQNMNMSNMSLGMNNLMYNPMAMNMGMGAMQMPMGGYAPAAPTYDAIGMGPPLNPQQRANIDRWRQGIA